MHAITKFSLLTLPILIVTIDTKIFYQLSLLICLQKNSWRWNLFYQICTIKAKWLHKSPSQFWHFRRTCNPFFPLRWQKQCNFKRKKKVTSSLTHTRPNNSRHRKTNQMLAYILELWIHKITKGKKSSKILQEIPHTWGALSATRIGLWLGKQVGEVGRLICNESANSMPTSWVLMLVANGSAGVCVVVLLGFWLEWGIRYHVED